jgi:flagellar biosynthesis/type III secretory pathway ATPase
MCRNKAGGQGKRRDIEAVQLLRPAIRPVECHDLRVIALERAAGRLLRIKCCERENFRQVVDLNKTCTILTGLNTVQLAARQTEQTVSDCATQLQTSCTLVGRFMTRSGAAALRHLWLVT